MYLSAIATGSVCGVRLRVAHCLELGRIIGRSLVITHPCSYASQQDKPRRPRQICASWPLICATTPLKRPLNESCAAIPPRAKSQDLSQGPTQNWLRTIRGNMANETNALHGWERRLPVGCAAESSSLNAGDGLHQPHLHPVSRSPTPQESYYNLSNLVLKPSVPCLCARPNHSHGSGRHTGLFGESNHSGAGYLAPEDGLVQPPIISMKACPALASWAAAVNRLFSDVDKSSYAVNV
jgi:hypothetical protein